MKVRPGAGVALALFAFWLGACHATAEPGAAPSQAEPGDPVQFSFATLSGEGVSSDTTRGRTTALLFVTTYDLLSQGEAELLGDELSRHKPLANGVIVMLEAPRAAPLAQVWAQSIGTRLPIAMASPALLAGETDLGRIVGVPTLVVLDRRGRLISRSEGAVGRDAIRALLTLADHQR